MKLVVLSVCLLGAVLAHPSGRDVRNLPEQGPNIIYDDTGRPWRTDLLEGDIMVPPGGKTAVCCGSKYLWTNNILRYYITNSFTSSEANTIRSAMSSLQSQIGNCVQFQELSFPSGYYVNVIKDSGCWSYVGELAWLGWSSQDLSLGPGCVWSDIIKHEFMHALGFQHEQTRADRDSYVTIHWNNIISGTENNFVRYNENVEGGINHLQTSYDYYSLMHYVWNAFAIDSSQYTISCTNPDFNNIIGQGTEPSNTDILRIRRLYGCQA